MQQSMHSAFSVAAILCFVIANAVTCYLYLYPIAHGCAFPSPPTRGAATESRQQAPFRLLVLGDPQLEGDSSLPNAQHDFFSSLRRLAASAKASWASPSKLLQTTLIHDLPRLFWLYRKRLDLLGNDYYLAHIYRTTASLLDPTHVVVLGDLLGSQWISHEEFEERGNRYWKRVFRNGQKVDHEIREGEAMVSSMDDPVWKRRIINIIGNHDVGYAGDMSTEKIQRFERVFGKANWDVRFTLPLTGSPGAEPLELRLVILNSLNMDAPVLEYGLQTETYNFINDVIAGAKPVGDSSSATILLTHLPLHKEAGVCVDGPMINYYGSEKGDTIMEQNHLSPTASKAILEGIFGKSASLDAPAGGMGRNGVILTGHDHEGCDVYHHITRPDDLKQGSWTTERTNSSIRSRFDDVPGIREITVRSMMGDFGGNAGLLSFWYDTDLKMWKFQYDTCSLGVQHIWWAIHVFDLMTLIFIIFVGLTKLRSSKLAILSTPAKEKTL